MCGKADHQRPDILSIYLISNIYIYIYTVIILVLSMSSHDEPDRSTGSVTGDEDDHRNEETEDQRSSRKLDERFDSFFSKWESKFRSGKKNKSKVRHCVVWRYGGRAPCLRLLREFNRSFWTKFNEILHFKNYLIHFCGFWDLLFDFY